MTCRAKALVRRLKYRLVHDQEGSAAVEFAVVAPILILMLAGIFEIGMVIRAKLALTSVVSAAANHSLSVGSSVDDASAEGVAASLAVLLAGGGRSATVNLNNAVTAQLNGGNVVVASTGPDVSSCYCASRAGQSIVWGGAVDCGEPCTNSSVSGRFVQITATVPFSQSLGIYRFFSEDEVQTSAMVRLP